MESIKKQLLNIKTRDKIIVATSAIAILAIVASILAGISKGDNELAYKLGVKDAKIVGDKLESPYNISESSLDELIKKDKYISSNYDLHNRESSSLTNTDNRENYSITTSKSVIGIGDSEDNIFQSGITTYNNFNSPTNVTLMYPYTDDSEISSIKDSYSSIVGKLFNKDIAKYINKNSLDTFKDTIQSKSGDYKLDIFKGVQEEGTKKILILILDYNETNPASANIENYREDEENIYSRVQVFKDTTIKDMAETYSNTLGEHKESRLTRETHDESTQNGVTTKSASIGIRTVYKDNSATELSLGIYETDDSSSDTNTTTISAETSTRYRNTVEETVLDVEQVVSSLTGMYSELEDKIEKGVYRGNTKVKYGDSDLEVSILININSDIYGTYATVSLYS